MIKAKRYLYLLAGVALWGSLVPALATAAPNTQEPGQNLLVNPGFEGGWHWQADSFLGRIPDGWVAWWVDDATGKTKDDPDYWRNQRPEYGVWPNAFQIRSGAQCLQYGKRYATHTAGAHQQVSGITPGAKLQFSAWGFIYGKDGDPSRNPGYIAMKVGIDPTGGTNPHSGSVLWSGAYQPLSLTDGKSAWTEMSVQAEAQNSTVTVFVYSTQSLPMNDALTSQWDDTSLVVVEPAEEPTAPPPPAPVDPGPPPPPRATATPHPDGSIIHTVQSGDTLWAIAIQYASGSQLTAQQMLAQINQLNNNPSMIYSGQQLVIALPQNPLPAAVSTPESASEPAPAAPAESAESAESVEQPVAAAVSSEEPQTQPAAPAAPASGGTICVSAYHDRDGNGAHDASIEEYLANAGFTLSNETGVVASYTSDGLSEPYCFEQLIAGNYMLQLTKPAGYNTTTPEYWAVSLQSGDTINVNFGNLGDAGAVAASEQPASEGASSLTNLLDSSAASSEESQSEAKSESKSLLSKLGEIAIGVGGVFVFLLAVAVAVAFFASRRNRGLV